MSSPPDLFPVMRNAMRLAASVQRRLCNADALAKKDKSPVTVADIAVQLLVTGTLLKQFPGVPLVGEEEASVFEGEEGARIRQRVLAEMATAGVSVSDTDASRLLEGANHTGSSDDFWTLDPIDGTKGFLRGEQYAIALARVIDSKPAWGFLGCPNLRFAATEEADGGALFWAQQGMGAFYQTEGMPPQCISVSQEKELANLRFCESAEAGHSDHDWSRLIKQDLGIKADPVRMDSQCKYALVASGLAEVYVRLPTIPGYVERIWDHAAGALLVEEAGGKVTDLDGQPLDFSRGRGLELNRGVLATHGPFHEVILAAITASHPNRNSPD